MNGTVHFRRVEINTPSRPKQNLVGVGGLEVRGRQRLALTLVRYFMIARPQSSRRGRHNSNRTYLAEIRTGRNRL